MTREVDRLLARLASTGPQPSSGDDGDSRAAVAVPPSTIYASPPRIRIKRAATGPSRRDLIALWTRVFLGVAIGVGMTQWPYARGCGWPLVGYLAAVAMVVLAGAWIAAASWRLRNGIAHTLSLVLMFWGIVLAAEQVLPRIGYAAEQATWRCGMEPFIPFLGGTRPLAIARATL